MKKTKLEQAQAALTARIRARREEICNLGANVEAMASGYTTRASLDDAVKSLALYEMENRA